MTPRELYLSHAQLFIRLGLRLFRVARPIKTADGYICSCWQAEKCANPGKHPLERGWGDLATTDSKTIFRWWGQGGIDNIGIATGSLSGVVVIDIDPRNGGDSTLASLEHQHGKLPPTWRFLTGGGGQHILFKHPGGIVRNGTPIGDGIDVKSDGGANVAPPSLHVSGRRYAISPDHHPDNVALARLPNWLHELLTPPKPRLAYKRRPVVNTAYVSAAIRNAVARISSAPEGQRNDTLNREAYSLARFSAEGLVDEGELAYQLARAATLAGLEQRGIEDTLLSAFKRGV